MEKNNSQDNHNSVIYIYGTRNLKIVALRVHYILTIYALI
jgi:hypothetical protein